MCDIIWPKVGSTSEYQTMDHLYGNEKNKKFN